MKVIFSALTLLSANAAFSNAQRDPNLASSFELMRAAENLDEAIENFQNQSGETQPECVDPVQNYVKCFDVPDDIDDTTILAHPLLPIGLKVKQMSQRDYEMGIAMIQALLDSLDFSGCDEAGKYGLAFYDWLSEDDFKTPVNAATVVKDFINADGERNICASGPLTEATTDLLNSTFQDEFSSIRATAITMMAEKNVLNAIANMEMNSDEVQPTCMDPVGNYVSCMTIPLDIDETTFVAHPMIAAGTKLKDMKGTSDYDMALGMITSFRETVAPDDCDEVGNAGLASYEWSSINDATAPVNATSFVKDFMAEFPSSRRLRKSTGNRKEKIMMRYMCSTGAIDEYSAEDGPSELIVTSGKIMTASTKLDQTIENYKTSITRTQPVCMDPTTNYVGCVSAEEDIDDTEFIIHPIVPAGTKLSDLKDTPDYDMAALMIRSLTDAVTPKGCNEVGNVGLATFNWLSSIDFESAVTITTLVKDFEDSDGRRYICSSAPLEEY